MKTIVITGPTCSGKTAAAVELAEKIHGEIISADSRQIYRHMDIGTAKPSFSERARVPHHLIDILEPDESYTASDFKREAEKKILEITSAGKQALVAGGTGLYIRSLVYGISSGPGADKKVRASLETMASEQGCKELHMKLRRADPETAARIHPNDKRRIIRALEIYQTTGRAPSEVRRWESAGSGYIIIGLNMPRENLYSAINARVEQMFREGFIDEVKFLLKKFPAENLQSLEALGYREIAGMLKGLSTLEETKEKIKSSTRGYARRQLTWMRKEKKTIWIEITSDSAKKNITNKIMGFLK